MKKAKTAHHEGTQKLRKAIMEQPTTPRTPQSPIPGDGQQQQPIGTPQWGTQYEVCQHPTPDRLDRMPKRFTQIVYRFGDTGTRFSADEIIQRDMPDRPKSCSKATFINYHYQALSIAQKRGIIKKTMSPKRTHINCLQSVQYWERQLRGSRYRNASASYNSSNTTRSMYVRRLASFDRWLTARSFTIKQNVRVGNHTLEERILETRFENVEQLLTMFDDSAISKKDVTRIIRTYLIDPMHRDVGPSSMSTTFSAIMSYFAKNESPVGMKYDPRDHDTQEMRDEGGLTLDEWHRMLTEGKPSALLTAVLLVKFQAGLDSSTLADRFNFEAYSQIAKYFGTNNHAAWETARCPVPIRLVRMKTGVRFITFLDADAITAIQNYLDWRIGECGGFDPDGPLFVRSGRPLKSIWISMEMGKLAVNAGLQKKIGNRMYKIRAHELRDLLKTTLMDCGCAQYVADFILGHKPRDSYEKPAMYPDTLRREYAKASGKINVISKTESMLGGESPVGSEARLGEMDAEIKSLMEELARRQAISYRDDALLGTYDKKIEAMQRQIDWILSRIGRRPEIR